MKVGWRTKSLILSLFDVLGPGVLYFTQKHISRRAVIDLPAIPKAWKLHERSLSEYHPERLIEFGAGKNLGQNIFLARSGLLQHVVDLNPMLDLSLVNRVVGLLRERFSRPELVPIDSLADLRSNYGITYQAPVDMTRTAFDDNLFDMCISSNTLEHIPVAALKDILRELRRILKKGGVISAQIDYSDHYAQADKSISKLNFLRFSEQQWRKHNHRQFFQNRLRHNHYRKLFEDAGFEVLREEAQKPCRRLPATIDPALMTGDDSDFCKTGHWVLRNR